MTVGQPKAGAQSQPTHRGSIGFGLAFDGSAALSGANATTSLRKVTITSAAFGDGKRIPLHIRFKCADVLTLAKGDKAAVETVAADTWSNLIPATDIYLGNIELWLSAATAAALQYEVLYV